MYISAVLFLFLNVKTVVFWYKFKSYIYNKEIGKPDESLGRKTTGPVKWQPVA